ncbi:hypothetical protein C8R46DRAFT_1358706 [Mycena filopes]|nr:hypothetical protein C8R46DRAFT_1358706 [Mycena filopes]
MLEHLAADRAHVADLDARAADLRAQMLHLEESLRALRNKKLLTQKRLRSYRYPVLTLPTEITCEIFMHFLSLHPLRPQLTGIASPTLLTQVCRAWRAIALDTPKFWKAMLLMEDTWERQSQIFDLWVDRSRSYPLSIEIAHRHQEDVSSVLTRVLQHASRLEQLKASLPVHSMLKAPHFLPILRHLDLSLNSSPVPQEILMFSDAPQLQTVTLTDAAALGVVLPWSQLTSVTLNALDPHECASVLRQTPNLRLCELLLVPRKTRVVFPEIRLPCLVSLTLRGFHQVVVTGYLDTLVVPTLRSLKVQESFLGEDPIATLTSFISKSGCQLHHLHITGKIYARDRYRPAFPRIQRLSFYTPASPWCAVDELEDS